MDDRLLAVTADQRLSMIDLASGELVGHLQLPQAVRLPPSGRCRAGPVFLTAINRTFTS